MGFWEKFKVGCDIGLKSHVKHISPHAAQKNVYKMATKWEKQKAKDEKRAARKK